MSSKFDGTLACAAIAIHFTGYHFGITNWQRQPSNQASSCYENCNCLPSQPQLFDNIWIYPSKLYKKRSQFADKSITWKNAFPQFWQAHLRSQQLLPRVAAIFRPRRERSSRQLPRLVGQDKGAQQQRLLARKKASSRQRAEESSPS
jgi:hypothetical protein